MVLSSRREDMKEAEVAERDPTERYVRYDEILDERVSNTVYKGFDEVKGIEIAWSKIKVCDNILKCKENTDSLCAEASLLKSLKHDNIMRCYYSWFDDENNTIHMITEHFTSGNLREYRKKHNLIDTKAIKNWARQILRGLDYLHCHDPPIIHRNLKCENIFVNGNSGRVKIGDMGLALILEQGSPVHSIAGTPESIPFMAPELFEEDYDQLVDIYSFGMCLLQMVTRELPYSECSNSVQVHEKVSSGVMPAALSKVIEPQVKQLIEKCLAPASKRPAAIDLLNDPFLALTSSGISTTCSDLSLRQSVGYSSFCSMYDQKTSEQPAGDAAVELIKRIETENKIYTLQGKVKENNSISMTLWIGDFATGDFDKFEFEFTIKTDTTLSHLEETARGLGLSSGDIILVSELMKQLITELVPGSSSFSHLSSNSEGAFNHQNVPAEKLSTEEWLNAQNLLDVLSEQDPAYQLICTDTNSIPLDQTSSLILSSSNRSQHSRDTKQEQHGKHENAGSGNRECSKEVAKTHSSGLRKLLFTCRNKF